VEYGNGTKCYLNPDNYRKELYEVARHAVGFDMLSDAGKNSFEAGAAADSEAMLPDYNFPDE